MTFGGELTGGVGKWDQFAANKYLFGVKATFDETLYTTSLDESVIDVRKSLEAERIAREIESTATSNFWQKNAVIRLMVISMKKIYIQVYLL